MESIKYYNNFKNAVFNGRNYLWEEMWLQNKILGNGIRR